MSFSGQVYPNDTVGYFRIASSTGRQPIEPVGIGDFRIGAGADCQLRLGDSGIPEILAILCVDSTSARLRATEPAPAVLVNGSPVTECLLNDGDLVEVCDHRLLFRRVDQENRITLDEAEFDQSPLSMEELVDRLGEQIDLVEELTDQPDHNVMQLLTAVARSASNGPAAATPTSQSAQTDVEQVLNLLQQHHEASRIRLESLTEVLNNVVRQQKTIADTLELMSTRIRELDASVNFNQRRASA